MSSRIVLARDAAIEPIRWRRLAGIPASGEAVSSAADPVVLFTPQPKTPEASGGPPPEVLTAYEAKVETLTTQLQQLQAGMARREQQAREEGRQQGIREGETAASARLSALLEKLARTIQEVAGARSRYRHEAEQDVVRLATAIARRILHRDLAVDPGALLGLVKSAFEKLDAREVQRVRVHPDHTSIVKDYLDRIGAPQRIEVQADASLELGGAAVETARGMLDASIGTQLEEIERGFADLLARGAVRKDP